jgi:ABC-2 type transport system permease protein
MRWYISDSLVIARRSLEHVRQIPEKLLDVTLQPLMFVLLFAYVFGGVIAIPHGNYKEYLIGGILVQTIAFGVMGPGVSMATDMNEGIVDRFRSLPMARSAFLTGHVLAELLAAMLAVLILALSGLIVGWGIHSDVPHALAGFGLLILFTVAMIWIGELIGVMVRSPDAVMGIGFIFVFPLTFLSNVFVPADGLPAGLRAVAEWNPISVMVAAVRTLFGNPTALPADASWPLEHPVVGGLIVCALLLALTVPVTLWRFRVRTTG